MPIPAAPVPVIPWWKSRGVVWALSGVMLAVVDGVWAVLSGGTLTWRTVAIGVGGALALWFRANAKGFVRAILTGEPPTAPPGPDVREPRT